MKILRCEEIFLYLKERYISNGKVYHDGSIYKLHYSEVSRKLLGTLIDFLTSQNQRVVMFLAGKM